MLKKELTYSSVNILQRIVTLDAKLNSILEKHTTPKYSIIQIYMVKMQNNLHRLHICLNLFLSYSNEMYDNSASSKPSIKGKMYRSTSKKLQLWVTRWFDWIYIHKEDSLFNSIF